MDYRAIMNTCARMEEEWVMYTLMKILSLYQPSKINMFHLYADKVKLCLFFLTELKLAKNHHRIVLRTLS